MLSTASSFLSSCGHGGMVARRSFARRSQRPNVGRRTMDPLLKVSSDTGTRTVGSFVFNQMGEVRTTLHRSHIEYPMASVGRSLSSVASATTKTSSTTSTDSTSNNENKDGESKSQNKNNSKKDSSSLFFDNLGTIFLLVIASVIATLVRSSAGTKNRNTLRDALEDVALIDPMEMEELRLANSALDPDAFRQIMRAVYQELGSNHNNKDPSCTYQDFIRCVRRNMAQQKGEVFTVELGHLLDRLMVQIIKNRSLIEQEQKRNESVLDEDFDSNDNMSLSFFLTVLSMALYSDPKDRIRILYEILQQEKLRLQDGTSTSSTTSTLQGNNYDHDDGSNNDDHMTTSGSSIDVDVSIDQVRAMVGYLQESCQLPPDTQIVPTETKYPTQQWKRGTPTELVPWIVENPDVDSDVDLYAFASILRSKSVCAWGECYNKFKLERDDV